MFSVVMTDVWTTLAAVIRNTTTKYGNQLQLEVNLNQLRYKDDRYFTDWLDTFERLLNPIWAWNC